ncbi:MAG: A24 family peptidase [Pseudomonadota bacterium]
MDWGIYVTASLVGLVLGSFLNVVIHRGPVRWGLIDPSERPGGLARPRSHCPACKTPIPVAHLIPLIGFALAKGRCHACGDRISWRYPIVELLGALAVAGAVVVFGPTVEAGLAAIYLLTLIALAGIDFETGFLPDALTITLIVGGLAVNTVDIFAPAPDAVIGALAGYVIFVAVELAYRQIRGRDGLGRGDAKLLSAIGAWLGWTYLPMVVLIGSLATLAIVGIKSVSQKVSYKDVAIPFGPGLASAGFLLLLVPVGF